MKIIRCSSLSSLQYCPCFKSDKTRDTTAADRGTNLHALVAQENDITDELNQLPEEDRNAVIACRTYLKNLRNKATSDIEIRTEEQLETRKNDDIEIRGHLDVIIMEQKKRYINVIDWKFGKTELPEARENVQLMSYAFLIFTNIPTCQQVTTTLISPMQENATKSEYIWDRSQLPMIQEILNTIINRHIDPDRVPVLNWKMCQYCGDKADCPEMNKVILRHPETTNAQNVLNLLATRDLNPETRGKIQQVADWATDWAKQVKAKNLEAVLTDGEEIEGFKITRRKGTMTVENTAVAIKLIMNQCSIPEDIVLTACKLSIPQLIKGGDGTYDRATIESILTDAGCLRESDPVIYLKRSTRKRKQINE